MYAGKVGTGFAESTLAELGRALAERQVDYPPFHRGTPRARDVHWVRPELVAQIEFTEWTQDGQLRHPRFVGLREDKRLRDVVHETT